MRHVQKKNPLKRRSLARTVGRLTTAGLHYWKREKPCAPHSTRSANIVTVCTIQKKMCRTKLKSGDHESTIFNNLCSASTAPDSINLDHHTYKHLCTMMTTSFHLERSSKPVSIKAMADTGCQSCLIGIKMVNRLGISKDALIPVKMNPNVNTDSATIEKQAGSANISCECPRRQLPPPKPTKAPLSFNESNREDLQNCITWRD